MNGLSLQVAKGNTVRLETDLGPVLIHVKAPSYCRLKIEAPRAVRIWRPADHDKMHPPIPRPHFRSPTLGFVRSGLIRALDQLARSEGQTREDTHHIDEASAILGELIRRLDPIQRNST